MDCIIYKIEDNTDHRLYIGSTSRTLTRRLQDHKDKKNCAAYEIIETGDYIICEIEKCDSENRRYREQFWIDNSDNCINKQRALRTPEQKKEYQKVYDKILYNYQKSWGGDRRFNNNLLMIDINYFC